MGAGVTEGQNGSDNTGQGGAGTIAITGSGSSGGTGGSGIVVIKEPEATVKVAPGMWTLNEHFESVKAGDWV